MTALQLLSLVSLSIVSGCAMNPRTAAPLEPTSPRIVRINDNGAWCWYQNERAILHHGKVYVSSIADDAGVNGAQRKGDVDLACWDLQTNQVSQTALHKNFEDDDHDVGAIYARRDGRLVVLYGRHNNDPLQYWRVSTSAADPMAFGPVQTLDIGANYTYQNVYRMASEGDRLYNFHRGFGFNPNYNLSDDEGLTWRYGGRFLQWQRPAKDDPKYTGLDGGRPYPRYAGNGVDQIHVVTTEDHPRAYDNSIYHGYISKDTIHRSDGSVVAPLSTERDVGIKPTDLTLVYEGGPENVAWTSDIRLDNASRPYIGFTVQMNDAAHRVDGKAGGDDIRYHYARFDGKKWVTREIAFGGTRLYAPEVDYSGLITLHPYDPNTLFISTNADPLTGTPLISAADGQRRRELYKGHTRDNGKTWSWTPLTRDSTADNFRPIVPPGDRDRTVLLWFRGTYRTYTDYATEVVGIVDP